MNDELNQLIAKICDGRADDDELARLTELLRRDPAARDEYLRQTDLHAALADEALPLLESNIINYTPSELRTPTFSPGFGWDGLLKLAAVLAIIMGTVTFLNRQPATSPPGSTTIAKAPQKAIATLLFAENCQWQVAALAEGTRLPAGHLVLMSGTAILRLDGGAEAVLTGPVDLELESAGSARLHSGEVVIRATDGAEGFTLRTPASEVIDLGTEFAV